MYYILLCVNNIYISILYIYCISMILIIFNFFFMINFINFDYINMTKRKNKGSNEIIYYVFLIN